MRKILLLLSLSTGLAALGGFSLWPLPGAAQQVRFLPPNGKRGITGNSLPLPQVAIGRDTRMMAPGALIFDAFNRTIVHGSLPVGADVWYQINDQNQITRIYILRPEEQARLDSQK